MENEATFERCPHDKENPYAQISREMFEDRSISPKAKGVLGYLLTRRPGWIIYHGALQNALNVGEEYINSAMKELIEAGYVDRTREQFKGAFKPYKYTVREFKKSLPDRVFRSGISGPENPVLCKKEEVNKEKVNKESSSSNICGIGGSCVEKDKGAVAPAPKPASAGAAAENSRESDVIYKTSRGDTKKLSQSEIYRHFAKSVYSTDVIKQAVKHMQETMEIVNSPLKLLESICKRLAQNPKNEIKSSPEKAKPMEEKKYYTTIRGQGINININKTKNENPNV